MVSDETIQKIATWLRDFDYSVNSDGEVERGLIAHYYPDAKDLVEKCGLTDE